MTHCFCLLGWHFYEEFYENIYKAEGKKYIISHRPHEFLAGLPFYAKIQSDVFCCENRGLEWGGYQQFNAMKLYEPYDFVIYCHDDLIIKDTGFVNALRQKFTDPKVKVVGNGRNGSDWEFRYEKYKFRMPYAEADDFLVRTVRGSFFAARTEIFKTIENFPVQHRSKKMSGGNIALRSFGYLVSKHFGREAIAYLADEHLETKYLVEMRRGEVVEQEQ